MADRTEKDLFGDGWTTYHDDGTTSKSYKDIFGNLQTYHEDGSVSTTTDDLFGGGQTTYHSDGSKSHTVDSFFGDSKITYNDDGSVYRTQEGFFGGYYVTDKIIDSYSDRSAGFNSGVSDTYYSSGSMYDDSLSSTDYSIGNNLYDDTFKYTYRVVSEADAQKNRLAKEEKEKLSKFADKISGFAKPVFWLTCILEVVIFTYGSLKYYSSFYDWFPAFAVYMLLPTFLLGLSDTDSYESPIIFGFVVMSDLMTAMMLGFQFVSWWWFGGCIVLYVIAMFGGGFVNQAINARYGKMLAAERKAKEEEIDRKEEEKRKQKEEARKREESLRWKLVERLNAFSSKIPAKAEYFVLPNLTVTTEIPYGLYKDYGPNSLDERTIRELAKNIAAELTIKDIPFSFQLVIDGRKTGCWLWDYGESFFDCFSNENRNERIYSAFVITDVGELRELKNYRNGISYSEIKEEVQEVSDQVLKNCNISWYEEYEDYSHLPANTIFRRKGRGLGSKSGIRSFDTEYEGIFSRLLYMISLTGMPYEEFAIKYKYRVKQNDRIFSASNHVSDALFEVSARLKAEDSWQKDITVTEDDTVEIQLHYKNLSKESVTDIRTAAYLDLAVEYIKGSTILYNASNPKGLSLSDDIVVKGLSIGGYAPNGDAYVRFKVKAKKIDAITAVNWFFVTNSFPVKAENILIKVCEGKFHSFFIT